MEWDDHLFVGRHLISNFLKYYCLVTMTILGSESDSVSDTTGVSGIRGEMSLGYTTVFLALVVSKEDGFMVLSGVGRAVAKLLRR